MASSNKKAEHTSLRCLFTPVAGEKLKDRFPGGDFNLFHECQFSVDVQNVILQEQLAKGSYGVVYAGSYNGEPVAVKIEDLMAEQEDQVNVLTELTVMQSLSHPHLVCYKGAGSLVKSEQQAKVLILMEVCSNGALRERLYDSELSWSLLVRLSLDVCRGLGVLHARGVVHRDVKTTNVLIDSQWRAKICDFSFCIQVQQQEQQQEQQPAEGHAECFVYGTTEFMAPEIALGERFGVPADIFSFGILLCEVICRRPPGPCFLQRGPRNFFALDRAELSGAVQAGCPESLEALALQCCETEQDKRPAVGDCVEWLEAILEDLERDTPPTLPPPSVDIAVPLGLMTAQREGSVKCPSSSSTAERGINTTPSPVEVPVFQSEMEDPVLGALREMQGRMSFLEVQVQELRTENSSLTKELTALQHDYLEQHQEEEVHNAGFLAEGSGSKQHSRPDIGTARSGEDDSLMSSTSSPFPFLPPRKYRSRLLHPGSPSPVLPLSPHLENCYSRALSLSPGPLSPDRRLRGDFSSDRTRERNGETLLMKRVATMERQVALLAEEVRHLASRSPLSPVASCESSGSCCVSDGDDDGDGDSDRDSDCDSGGSSRSHGKNVKEEEVILRCVEEKNQHSTVGHAAFHGDSGGEQAQAQVQENLAVVMNTFLRVVERCSASKQRSLRTLSDIDQSSRANSTSMGTGVDPFHNGSSSSRSSSSNKSHQRLQCNHDATLSCSVPLSSPTGMNAGGHSSSIECPVVAAPPKRKSFLSQALSPKVKSLLRTPQSSQMRWSPRWHEDFSPPQVEQGKRELHPDNQVEEEEQVDVWKDIPSQEPKHRSDRAADRHRDRARSAARVDLSAALERDGAGTGVPSAPPCSPPPHHVDWNYDHTPLKHANKSRHSVGRSGEGDRLTPEGLKAQNFFKGDHLYNYVFGREHSSRSRAVATPPSRGPLPGRRAGGGGVRQQAKNTSDNGGISTLLGGSAAGPETGGVSSSGGVYFPGDPRPPPQSLHHYMK